MLFLVISTKKNGFKKAIVNERTPSEYMALAVKKNRTDKKKVQYYTTKHNKKKHVIYSTRWTEKKRDFPYIFHSKICLFYATFCDHFLCLVKKKILKKKDKLTILVSFMCKKKDMIFLSLTSYYDPPQEKKIHCVPQKTTYPCWAKEK